MNKAYTFLLLIPLLLISGCKIQYTFSGADVGSATTFSVKYFDNKAEIIVPTLSQYFTEELKDKFLSGTSLKLVNSQGELHFEGEIIGYTTSPLAIQDNDQPAQNRLTVTIQVRFTNSTKNDFDFDTKFTRFSDYNSSRELSDVENELIEIIVEEIIEDIFNKSVVNW